MHRNWEALALSIAAASSMVLSGCGASSGSTSSLPTSTLQPQSQPATGPMLGYVWDATGQALHPVRGIPGASIVGPPSVTAPSQGARWIAASSSARSGMALFLDADGGIFQSSLNGGTLTQVAGVPGAKSLLLSNSGVYALITGATSSGAGVAALISGLPQNPATSLLDSSKVNGILGGAASDTGTVTLAANSSANGQSAVSIFSFAGQHAPAQIAIVQAFGGMQWVPNSDELILADGATGTLTAVSHVNSAPVSASLAGSISLPAALDITPDARWVVVANHAGDILRIDLTGAQAPAKVHCACAPDQVSAMNGTTLRLTAPGNGPLWIVDAGAAAPRVLFVPAIAASTASGVSLKSKL